MAENIKIKLASQFAKVKAQLKMWDVYAVNILLKHEQNLNMDEQQWIILIWYGRFRGKRSMKNHVIDDKKNQ